MDPTTLMLIRSAAVFWAAQGRPGTADALTSLANASMQGVNIDRHMAFVADKIAAGVDLDFVRLEAEIQAEVDRGGGVPDG